MCPVDMHDTTPLDRFYDVNEPSQPSCPFCGSTETCVHQVARFDSGVSTRLEESMAGTREGLLDLVAAARRSVATDSPRPLALRVLPGGGRFLARIEQAWRAMAAHARNDGDLDGWLAILEADTDAAVADWIAHCIWSLGDGPVVTNTEDGIERWYCGDPAELRRRIEAGLSGRSIASAVGDPIRLVI